MPDERFYQIQGKKNTFNKLGSLFLDFKTACSVLSLVLLFVLIGLDSNPSELITVNTNVLLSLIISSIQHSSCQTSESLI